MLVDARIRRKEKSSNLYWMFIFINGSNSPWFQIDDDSLRMDINQALNSFEPNREKVKL